MMSEKEIISVLKYVLSMRSEFLLSEIKDYIESEMSTQEIYDSIEPFLFELDINSTPVDGDFKIKRSPARKQMELTDEEIGKNQKFFKSAGVSRKLQRIIEQYIERKTSKNWDDPVFLERMRKAINAQKSDYWKKGKSRNISYEKGYSVLGYLGYQFPVYFIQFEHIFYSMALEGLLKTKMKILDVGTGPGTVPLAIIDMYNRLDDHEATIHSVELYDENIEAYNTMVPQYAKIKSKISVEEPIKTNIIDLKPQDIPDNIDLMVFSNVLNEIKELTTEKKAELVNNLSKKLADDGSIVIIEPADKVNSTQFRKLTIALKEMGIGIYSPCSFIWCSGCRPDECWSFEQKKDIKPTRLMEKLAECDQPYRYINTDIKYSYAILRKDNLTKLSYRVPPKAKYARFSKLRSHVGKRINVICSLMSGDLGNQEYSVYKVCDGTSRKQVYAVLPLKNITSDNMTIKKTRYGRVIEIRNVLVKYNEEKDAYNLLIGEKTDIKQVNDLSKH